MSIWASSRFVSKADEVHVWQVNMDDVSPVTARMTGLLSPGERERAKRFRFPRDRRRFVIRHVVLRLLLGRYLDGDPGALRFSRGVNGKPALAGRSKDALSFNMAHSAGLVLYAVTHGREVGIDVEWVRREVDDLDIARQYFSIREAEALSALTLAQRRMAFFRLWTSKEAFLKATGLGLSFSPRRVEVSPNGIRKSGPKYVVSVDSSVSRWLCRPFTPADDYVAAVVAPGDSWAVSQYDATWIGNCFSRGNEMRLGLG